MGQSWGSSFPLFLPDRSVACGYQNRVEFPTGNSYCCSLVPTASSMSCQNHMGIWSYCTGKIPVAKIPQLCQWNGVTVTVWCYCRPNSVYHPPKNTNRSITCLLFKKRWLLSYWTLYRRLPKNTRPVCWEVNCLTPCLWKVARCWRQIAKDVVAIFQQRTWQFLCQHSNPRLVDVLFFYLHRRQPLHMNGRFFLFLKRSHELVWNTEISCWSIYSLLNLLRSRQTILVVFQMEARKWFFVEMKLFAARQIYVPIVSRETRWM